MAAEEAARDGGGRASRDFTIDSILHHGNRGVCVATAKSACGDVSVLKIIPKAKLLTDAELMTKVGREVLLLLELNHPFIVRGLESWSDSESLYLRQEFCARGDLVKVAGQFPARCIPEFAVSQKIMLPVLEALCYLHGRGIIHRDLKPENLIVTAEGVCKICDFGLAIDTCTDTPVSRVGTLEFMAPEIVRLGRTRPEVKVLMRRSRCATHSFGVDIWALGCVVFECLYGFSLFGRRIRGTLEEVERLILSEKPLVFPNYTRALTKVSPAAIEFITAALTRNEHARPSADALLGHRWITNVELALVEALPEKVPQSVVALLARSGSVSSTCGTGSALMQREEQASRPSEQAAVSQEELQDGSISLPAPWGPLVALRVKSESQAAQPPQQRAGGAPPESVWPPALSPTSTLFFPSASRDALSTLAGSSIGSSLESSAAGNGMALSQLSMAQQSQQQLQQHTSFGAAASAPAAAPHPRAYSAAAAASADHTPRGPPEWEQFVIEDPRRRLPGPASPPPSPGRWGRSFAPPVNSQQPVLQTSGGCPQVVETNVAACGPAPAEAAVEELLLEPEAAGGDVAMDELQHPAPLRRLRKSGRSSCPAGTVLAPLSSAAPPRHSRLGVITAAATSPPSAAHLARPGCVFQLFSTDGYVLRPSTADLGGACAPAAPAAAADASGGDNTGLATRRVRRLSAVTLQDNPQLSGRTLQLMGRCMSAYYLEGGGFGNLKEYMGRNALSDAGQPCLLRSYSLPRLPGAGLAQVASQQGDSVAPAADDNDSVASGEAALRLAEGTHRGGTPLTMLALAQGHFSLPVKKLPPASSTPAVFQLSSSGPKAPRSHPFAGAQRASWAEPSGPTASVAERVGTFVLRFFGGAGAGGGA